MTLEQERQKRIVTTHVGSLPRPDALSHMMADGDTHRRLLEAVRDAVNDVISRQVDVGLDIVDDGEQSKPGFITYIHERLGGMEARKDNPPQHRHAREALVPGVLRARPFRLAPGADAVHRAGELYRPEGARRPTSRT